MKVAIGVRPHSGWMALVVVAGSARAPEVLDRMRVELADPALTGSKQPYHLAEGLPVAKAEKIVSRCSNDAKRLAGRAFADLTKRLRAEGRAVAGCGLLLASGRPLPALASILASHALIHTADGELFREAIAQAAREHAVPVVGVREKELWERAEEKLPARAGELQAAIAAVGKSIGPPWRQDEKLATVVALVALASA